MHEEAVALFDGLVCHLREGRAGHSWCQYAWDSIKQQRFMVADGRAVAQETNIQATIRTVAKLFASLKPFVDIEQSRLDTLTVLCNPYTAEIEQCVHEMRQLLLQQGIMLGVLHPHSVLRSLSSDVLTKPYRVEGTFVTVRWAVPEDGVFTSKNPQLSRLLQQWLNQSSM